MENIKEVVNEFLSAAIDLLSELLNKSIDVESIDVIDGSLQEAIFTLPEDVIIFPIKFTGEVTGDSAFVISEETGSRVAEYLMGNSGEKVPDRLSNESISNVSDAFSQLGVVIASSLSTFANKAIQSGVGQHLVGSLSLATLFIADEISHTTVKAKVEGFDVSFEYIMSKNLNDQLFEPEISTEPAAELPDDLDALDKANTETVAMPAGADLSESTEETKTVDFTGAVSASEEKLPSAEASFPQLKDDRVSSDKGNNSRNIDLLMDVPLEVTVELGRTKMAIKDLLDLSEGSIVELDKLAGEPVDFLVNGRLISRGEVVVIDENFGVRITEIISPAERLSSL